MEYPVAVPAYTNIDPTYQASPGRVVASWPDWSEIDYTVYAHEELNTNVPMGPPHTYHLEVTRSDGEGVQETFHHDLMLLGMAFSQGVDEVAQFLNGAGDHGPGSNNYEFKSDGEVNHSSFPDTFEPGNPNRLALSLEGFYTNDTVVIQGNLTNAAELGFPVDEEGVFSFYLPLKKVKFEYSTVDKVVANSRSMKTVVGRTTSLENYSYGDFRPKINPGQFYCQDRPSLDFVADDDFATHSFLYYVPENIVLGSLALYVKARDIPILPTFRVAFHEVDGTNVIAAPYTQKFQTTVSITATNGACYGASGGVILPRGWYMAAIRREGQAGLCTLAGEVPAPIYQTGVLAEPPNVRLYGDAGFTEPYDEEYLGASGNALVTGVVPRLYLGIQQIL